MTSQVFTEAPAWRREPYRLLFPIGILLAWGGVLHWLLLALHVTSAYQSIFHAMTQIQAFMTCFAAGFLFTFIPRRTKTAAPSPAQMAIAILAPVATAVFAWFERWALAQAAWLILMGTLVQFIWVRFRAAPKAPLPSSFVWVPFSIASSMVFAVITGAAAAAGPEYMWLHDVGRGVILQGLFVGLVLGVGGMLIPIITRGDPARAQGTARGRLLHLGCALVFLASFWVEVKFSLRWAFAMRALVTLGVLTASARMWRLPTVSGAHRWLVWLGAWFLPLGYALGILWPEYKQAALHVVFIGCFALMAFSVSSHVVRAHSGDAQSLHRPRRALAMATLLGLALAFRVLVVLNLQHFYLWLGLAAGCFLAATLAWVALLLPLNFKAPAREPG